MKKKENENIRKSRRRNWREESGKSGTIMHSRK
jgi:hypothetical protein